MDYIKGETLEEYVQKNSGVLPLRKTLAIAIELCGILHYLHKRKPPIIFRDMKPANIMRTRKGRLYLIDFGIARRFTPGQRKDTGPLGSPGYAAPEQYGSRASTTPRTDIYGLAVTIQTLLTGEDPALLARGTAATLPAHAPPVLQRLLAQMMEHDPEKRPHNMLNVRRQLMLIKEGPVGLAIKYVLSFLYGLFIGSLPYSPILLVTVILRLFHTPWYGLPFPLTMLMYLLLCTWPFAFITQIIIGCRRLFAPRTPYQRLIGAGILLMLIIMILMRVYGGMILPGLFWLGGRLFW
jgi:serine/threonine protein kinase